ncbi:AAA domain-containing protein [Halalkalibacter alkaliphilus]|uniref:AAA domain-containing protein n=1 Tax=Halalkalibacter alkaliphilus TaxID=2917993 RepID=A0A9X2CR93_9BACI|nr:AAA domain-containing protein [Halalkalibacter alkaliphilus]MCL7745590.1 AAA domain-containing protein [Halalkalibacter alkaliphilus]
MKEKLVHMRDKLNDISKRNRSIRLLKLYNKWSLDLHELDRRIEAGISERVVSKVVSNSKSDIPLFSVNINDDDSLSLSRKVTDLFRNMKAIEDETGVYDFYLGYPFIQGTMVDGTFFQAPLFLYPIRLEKDRENQQKWVLKYSDDEPQINRTLFLALKKVNGMAFSEDWLDGLGEIATTHDFTEWKAVLKDVFPDIQIQDGEIMRLREYKRDEIPNQSNVILLKHAVIGNFPQGGSAIVKDYDQMIQLNEEDDLALAQELIDPTDDIVDLSSMDSQEREKDRLGSSFVKEEDKLFLMQTDGSQEEILEEARYQKGLVVHGPPGTGKSQVIVNLITDALHQKKKVLVVCQKRAALDVIYQRLESLTLAQHTALIHDEKHDRKALYGQIEQLLNQPELLFDQAAKELEELSDRIAAQEVLLNSISKALFEYHEFGYRLYDLYGQAKPMEDMAQLLDVSDNLPKLSKTTLEVTLAAVYSYGEWYERFGKEDYPLKMRKSFASMEMKDKLTVIETLQNVLTKAESSVAYLNALNHEKITPAYTWLVNDKLGKVYGDLNPEKKRTLQGLRLWWWTSFTGKQIIEELLNGQKFKGVSSTEWLTIREGLKIMYELSNETQAMAKQIEKLKVYINDDVVERMKQRVSEGDIPIEELDKMLEYIHQDFEDLRQMDSYLENSTDLVKSVVEKLKEKEWTEVSSLSEVWVELVRNSTFIHWIDQVERNHPDVKKISTNEFARIRELFAKGIDEKREVAKKFLRHELSEATLQVKAEKGRRIKELNHQVTKKRRIWPLRKVIEEFAHDGLLEILPVWLTSPETVSSIFPLEEGLFDLVIFDEASQCTVESSIAAIYRAKQVIVAGDEKQLPPFNMFQSSVSGDEDEEEYDIDDSQSLLNLAKRRFPEKILQWHYRSKYEDLINFSNHAFYQGQVQIAPNVEPLREPPALQWKKVDGLWVNQSNEIEAQAVVEEIKQLLVKAPNKTIGVITFNAKQQDKILDMIDKRVQEDPEFQALYNQVMSKDLDERIFVKNIENVQGDERDVILFSIGYAKNEEGRIYNRFGMLNQQGGENRLNVAVTRAKEGIIVISSIEPEELNVASTAHIGPRILKSYLQYVRAVSQMDHEQVKVVVNDVRDSSNTRIQQTDVSFDSPFEEQVYKQLLHLGYKVDTQVGMSGYRIDLAIIHPNDPQRYILGVECDGAMYHSSKNAKERDVYRQRFLENRGWTIERIWSRNWWRNASMEIERIDQKVKQLMKEEEVRERVKV